MKFPVAGAIPSFPLSPNQLISNKIFTAMVGAAPFCAGIFPSKRELRGLGLTHSGFGANAAGRTRRILADLDRVKARA